MKKRYFIYSSLLLLIISMGYLGIDKSNNKVTKKEIIYNGNNLRVSIDGVSSNTLPTGGNYYLVNYDCQDKNTLLSWDIENHKLNVSNGTKGKSVACYLEFKSNPKLSEMPVGSYVAYEGVGGTVGSTNVACKNGGSASSSTETDETEAPNSCMGQNAREDLFDTEGVYGYCYSHTTMYLTTGWRIAYKEKDKAMLISAGSPECSSRTISANNLTYVQTANAKALKYCNPDFVDGDCSCIDDNNDGLCDEKSTDAWGIDENDFKNITSQLFNIKGGYFYTGNFVDGDIQCINLTSSSEFCGYNNNLIDNGGNYWFASIYPWDELQAARWYPSTSSVSFHTGNNAYGLRPVISLSSSVIVLGGKGTMEEPYIIGNNTFSINSGASYINASDDKSNVTLNLIRTDDVSQMCISVDSSVCSNYVDFSKSYTLDWSSEEDGEKEVYVYYKDSTGNIIATMNKNIVIDTSGPGEGSISFMSGDGLFRTINVYSKGADYMCFSNTSNDINNCTEWVKYAKTYNWVVEQGVGSKTVYAFFKDDAGNTLGPYSATTTCTNDCEYKYFIDAYNDNNIYIMRNDGATALVTTTSTDVTWYTKNTYKMKVCGADNYYRTGASAYVWCIGEDNNGYYKNGYSSTTWNKVNISNYTDISTYTYSFFPIGTSYSYMVRSDGKINRLNKTGYENSSWGYGYAREMAVCSGYGSNRIICVGKDGKYYYSTNWESTSDYLGGSIVNLTDRTNENSWIDMYYSTYSNIIESDGTNLYTARFVYNSASTIWHTSPIPGNGVEYCASGGYSTNNYCLAKDGYLYYKSYDATSWTNSNLKYE